MGSRVSMLIVTSMFVVGISGCGSQSNPVRLPPIPTTAATSASSSTTTPATTTTSSATTSPSAACMNQTATAEVKAALVTADGRPDATERPGTTFFGTCGPTAFAVASFQPSASASTADSVAFQDHGAYPEFFVMTAGSQWKLVGSASGPPQPADCTAFEQAPAAMRTIWGNCMIDGPATSSASPSASTTSSVDSACATYAQQEFAIIDSVEANADGTARLTAHRATVHCGGPDDKQFIAGAAETLVIAAGADIEIINPDVTTTPMPTDVAGLMRSVASNSDGNTFEVMGPSTGLTSVVQQFRP